MLSIKKSQNIMTMIEMFILQILSLYLLPWADFVIVFSTLSKTLSFLGNF